MSSRLGNLTHSLNSLISDTVYLGSIPNIFIKKCVSGVISCFLNNFSLPRICQERQNRVIELHISTSRFVQGSQLVPINLNQILKKFLVILISQCEPLRRAPFSQLITRQINPLTRICCAPIMQHRRTWYYTLRMRHTSFPRLFNLCIDKLPIIHHDGFNPLQTTRSNRNEEFHFRDVSLFPTLETLDELCKEHRSTEFPICNGSQTEVQLTFDKCCDGLVFNRATTGGILRTWIFSSRVVCFEDVFRAKPGTDL